MKTKYNDWISLGMYFIGSLIFVLPFKQKLTKLQYVSVTVFTSFLLGMLNAIIQSVRKLTDSKED